MCLTSTLRCHGKGFFTLPKAIYIFQCSGVGGGGWSHGRTIYSWSGYTRYLCYELALRASLPKAMALHQETRAVMSTSWFLVISGRRIWNSLVHRTQTDCYICLQMKRMGRGRSQAVEKPLFLLTDARRTRWFPHHNITKIGARKGLDNKARSLVAVLEGISDVSSVSSLMKLADLMQQRIGRLLSYCIHLSRISYCLCSTIRLFDGGGFCFVLLT